MTQRKPNWLDRQENLHADQIIGYQGPVDSLLVMESNGTLKAMTIRSSFENQPYADYPKDDAYFASLLIGDRFPN